MATKTGNFSGPISVPYLPVEVYTHQYYHASFKISLDSFFFITKILCCKMTKIAVDEALPNFPGVDRGLPWKSAEFRERYV